MSKRNEIKVDDLMNSQGGTKKLENSDSKSKKASEADWDNDDADNTGAAFLKHESKIKDPKAKKSQKKENTAATWGDLKETPPVEEKQEAPQPTEKKRIMVKPGAKNIKPDVNVNQFDFPELGQEAPKEEAKQEQPKPVTTSNIQSTTSAPIKFQNAKKTTQGETFAKIETPVEKEPPKVEPKPITTSTSDSQPIVRGGFRRENKLEEKPAEEEAGKFKFGGEGPVKFVKSDKTKPKEETKTKEDLLREQKEREIEEKLQKEREEAQKKDLEKKKREAANPIQKNHDGKPFNKKHDEKSHEEENKNNDGPIERRQHTEKKEEVNHTQKNENKHENNDNKSGPKFRNANKTPKEQPKTEVITPEVPESKEVEPQETKEVVTKASTASWGEGLKKKKN